MIVAQHVRFWISELVTALESYGKLRRPSISEALTYYYNWAMAHGWRLTTVVGQSQRDRVWIVRDERTPQIAIQHRDVLYEVVWTAEDAQGPCDYLDSHPVSAVICEVVEELEARGWRIDLDRDGYSRGDKYIPGQLLVDLWLPEGIDPEDSKTVTAIADDLEARAV